MNSKTCNTCSQLLPFSDFHNNKRGRFGKQSSCKKCSAEYGQKRKNSPHVKALKIAAKKRWRARYPKKLKAQKKLQNAVAWGQIIKPDACEMCNKKGRLEGHHADYDYPFDVEWFCHSCHHFWHQVNGEAKNASL